MASAVDTAVRGHPLADELADLAERLRESVVQVRAGRAGIGSGVVWPGGSTAVGADGGESEVLVVTCDHVVRASSAGALTLVPADGRVLTAEVVARDPAHDLALLRTRAHGLHPAEVGDSAALRVGELVLAVGNPLGRVNVVTAGIVAARAPADPDQPLEPVEPGAQAPDRPRRERPGDSERSGFRTLELIQADVRLFPGNSGGPLADAHGRVVGINSMVAGGLGLSVPSRHVQRFVELARATEHGRPYLGVRVLTVDLPEALRSRLGVELAQAALVAEVEPESPAAAAGLLVGDLLIGVDGRAAPGSDELLVALGLSHVGQTRVLTLLRGGERRELSVTLGHQPEEAAA
jgi:serine protease Do